MDAVIERLNTLIPSCTGRVFGAANFADLMKRNALPQQTPALHVLLAGLRGGRAEAATGAFVQEFVSTISVLLTIRSHDATGARALETLDPLIFSIIEAIVGWAPSDETGVYQLARANLVNMQAGTMVYQFDFSINDQLRVTS